MAKQAEKTVVELDVDPVSAARDALLAAQALVDRLVAEQAQLVQRANSLGVADKDEFHKITARLDQLPAEQYLARKAAVTAKADLLQVRKAAAGPALAELMPLHKALEEEIEALKAEQRQLSRKIAVHQEARREYAAEVATLNDEMNEIEIAWRDRNQPQRAGLRPAL